MKFLIKVDGISLIEKIILDAKKSRCFKRIIIITQKKSINIIKSFTDSDVEIVSNEKPNLDMSYSLLKGLDVSNDDSIVTYSDIYFNPIIFKKINKLKKKNILIPATSNWKKIWKARKKDFYYDCESFDFDKSFNLKDIGNKITDLKKVKAQYMGIIYVPYLKAKLLSNIIKKNKDERKDLTFIINQMIIKKKKIKCLINNYYWYEFDDYDDIRYYKKIFNKKISY